MYIGQDRESPGLHVLWDLRNDVEAGYAEQEANEREHDGVLGESDQLLPWSRPTEYTQLHRLEHQ